MEGSASKPAAAKGGMSKKTMAIVAVGALLVAGVGGAALLMNNPSEETAADNWLEKGFNMEVFYNSGNVNRQTACELLKTGLESLNPGKIKITVTPLEWSNYLEYRSTGKMPAMFLGWLPDYADADNYLQPFALSAGTYANMIGLDNETLDDMVLAASTELNQTERGILYEEISNAMYEECYYVLTAQATNFHVERDWVEGYYFNPMYSGYYYYSFNKTATSDEPTTFRQLVSVGNADSFDPARNYETVGGELVQNVYETLFWYNGSSSSDLVPQLAEEMPTVANGGISENGLFYNITIRSGVEFSDGTPMDAYDVEYSFDRALMWNNPESGWWMYGQNLVPDYYDYGMATFNATTGAIEPEINATVLDEHIWAKDATHIQFNLTQVYPAFISTLVFSGSSIVSEDYVEANGGTTEAGYLYMASHMLGTGPFKLGAVSASAYYTLERNDNYWKTPAALETVLISMTDDVNARIATILAGDADAAYIPRDKKTSVEGQPGIRIVAGLPTLQMDFLGMNQDLNVTGANPELTNVPSDFFQDANVRKAFASAFNYDSYITNSLNGYGIQPNSIIPQGLFGWSEDVPKYEFNLTKAADYLRAAKVPTDNTSSSAGMLEELSAALFRWEL